MPFRQNEEFPAFSMSAEDMNAFLNSFDSYDLYINPNYSAAEMDYQTQSINPDNIAAFFVSGPPKSQLSLIRPMSESETAYSYRDIPGKFKPRIQEAVYAHELGHFLDPRMPNSEQTPYPFITDSQYEKYRQDMETQFANQGHSPDQAKSLSFREAPANISEDLFWDEIFSEEKQ